MYSNQPRGERSESSQYRKVGRSGSWQSRNFTGGSGKGGGTAPPPSSSSVNPSRSFKKSNNPQGGQSRVNSDSNTAYAARTLQNCALLQPPVHGAADAPVTSDTAKPAMATQNYVPKAPSSQPSADRSDTTAPATPAKAPGDATRSFPLQFGSISPGLMNVMQIPARTNSAPPNLDEQKRDQVHHDSSKVVPIIPPSVPKQQMPRKDEGAGEAHQLSRPKNDVHVSSAPPVPLTYKAGIHSFPGAPMPMPFHQSQVLVQFGGPNSQIPSQGLTSTPLPMPFPTGNNTQLRQQVFIPSLQPHPVQPQGIMHQGQSINFTPQMGSQLLPQLGNLGIGLTSQFTQQQQAGVLRKPVKITHPDTHEELRLDTKTDMSVDSGSSGRSQQSAPPPPQPITSTPPPHPINYYSNSFNPNSLYFPGASSVPSTINQINPSSQTPGLTYLGSQGPQTVSFVNPSQIVFPNKNSTIMHGIVEHSHDDNNSLSPASSASVQVTAKPAAGSHLEKNAESSVAVRSSSAEKGVLPKFLQQPGKASSDHLQRDPESLVEGYSSKLKPGPELISSSLPVAYKQSTAAAPFSAHDGSSTVVTHGIEGRGSENISRSDSSKDQQKKQTKKGHSQPQLEVSGPPFSTHSLEHGGFFNNEASDTVNTKKSTAYSNTNESTMKFLKESLPACSVATADAPDDAEQGPACESTTLGISLFVDGLDPGNILARQNDSAPQGEPVKLDICGTKEQGSIMLNVITNSDESLEIAQKDLEEPVGLSIKDDVAADNLVISTSVEPGAIHAKPSLSSPSLFTCSDSDVKTATSDTSFSRSGSLCSREAIVAKSVASDEGKPLVSTTPPVPELTLKHEGEGTEGINAGFVSLPAAGSKDKPVLEFSRSKSNVGRGKKKRREILQKANASGTISDLYMAYKGPEGKKEENDSSEGMVSTSSIHLKQEPVDAQDDLVSGEKGGQTKAEPDDWEDAADISTSKLETADDGLQVQGLKHLGVDGNLVMSNKYSRDFLLKFSEQCTNLPEGFEITPDMAETWMVVNVNASRELYPSPGRVIDLPSVRPRFDHRDPRLDNHGGNFRQGPVANFGVSRNPRAQTPSPYAGGILSGPMQSLGSQGGIQRNNPDSDHWERAMPFQKGLFPSPRSPLQVMHKAEKKYEVGRVSDEEQAKQRQLKAILNKLTPQNFEKLFEQVKAVNIDNAGTLTGVISQIFDKALMEPTFCEMYANFCYYLAGELPDFSEDNEKITFKRLLLNKCQEEFERGEREQEEADRADLEGEVKQSEAEREEKRIRVRRRMLGNIRLIGELYKKRMLTERIMHECIYKLLGQYQNPDEENIEALCKLMSTIGEIIDHPKAKEHIDAYYDMMAKLSNNMKLSSRVRFMLKDAIDLRKNKWQQRRKVEGPKKIDEVHRDAAQERQEQAGRLARGQGIKSSVRNRQPMDFSPRGSSMLAFPNAQMGSFRGPPTQLRGFGAQDFRWEDRHSFENRTSSVPLPQRPVGEGSITLGPQGGLASGMSIRGQPLLPNIPLVEAQSPGNSRRMATGPNGYNAESDQTVHGREDLMIRFSGPSYEQSCILDRNMNRENRDSRIADRNFDRCLPPSPTMHDCGPSVPQNVSSDKVWPEERLRNMSLTAIRDFYSAQDKKEVALCVKDLNAPSFYPTMISIWVSDSFERKDMERDLLAKLLVDLSQSQDGMLNQDHLIQGFESVLFSLEDAVNDAPKAGEFLGRILAKVVSENVVPFAEIGQLIYEGGEEQGHLVEMGLAAEVVGTILESISSEKGESVLNEICASSSLKLEKFRPPDPKKSCRLDKFM